MRLTIRRAAIIEFTAPEEDWPATLTALENELRATLNIREHFSTRLRAAEPRLIALREIEENPD